MALALAIAVAIPSVTATAIKGDLEAHRMQTQGTSTFDATLVALLQAAIGQGMAAGDFQLEADYLRVETDISEPTFHFGVTNVISPTATTASQNYSTASVQGTSNRANHRFFLAPIENMPAPSIRVETSCSTHAASGQDSLTRNPRAQEIRNRPQLIIDTQIALQWNDCSGAAVITVTGDFELSLWEWDATLNADGDETNLESGSFQTSMVPADARLVASRDVELFLYARDATLIVPLTADAYALYVSDSLVESEGLTLTGANGELTLDATTLPTRASTLELEGNVRAALSGRGATSPFGLTLAGSASKVVLDGQAVAIATAPDGPRTIAWWGYALAVLAVLALAIALRTYLRPVLAYNRFTVQQLNGGVTRPMTWRERRGAGFWVLGTMALLLHGNVDVAFRYARRSERLFPDSVDARLLRAAAHQRTGSLQIAIECYKSAADEMMPGPDRAAVACQIARMSISLKRLDGAVSWLKKAAVDDLGVFEAAIGEPVFDALLDDPWFDGAREGHVRNELRRPRVGDWSGLPI